MAYNLYLKEIIIFLFPNNDPEKIELSIAENVTVKVIRSTVQNLVNNSQTKK